MKRQYEYYTYILLCSDGSYYTGITRDVTGRVSQHQLGMHPFSYTYTRRPVKLVYNACFNDVYEAIAWEKKIQRWSRKKKEALIRGDWAELPKLARSMYAKRIAYSIIMVRRAHHDNFRGSS